MDEAMLLGRLVLGSCCILLVGNGVVWRRKGGKVTLNAVARGVGAGVGMVVVAVLMLLGAATSVLLLGSRVFREGALLLDEGGTVGPFLGVAVVPVVGVIIAVGIDEDEESTAGMVEISSDGVFEGISMDVGAVDGIRRRTVVGKTDSIIEGVCVLLGCMDGH